ncbi:MAG: discoidin domain-containing protein [Planctomycetota bacterium]
MLQQADENKGEAATMYALLHEARDHAVVAGDVGLALDAQKRLRDSFKFDFVAMLADLRKLEATAKTAGPATVLASLFSLGADDALAVENYEQAVKYNSRAEDLIPLIKDAAIKDRLKAEIPRVLALKVASAAALAAQKTLATKPDDADANLIAGKFVLQKGDVQNAFAFLAKGKDEALKSLAKRELALPEKADEQVLLGDSWFEVGEKEGNANLKLRMKERAATWYTNALPALSGLGKLKVEGRLRTLQAVVKTEIAGATLPENKVSKWISKDATYTVSSKYSEGKKIWEPMKSFLNGDDPEYFSADDGFSFVTKSERCPNATVDLGAKCRIDGFEILNRKWSAQQDRAKTLTVWVSFDANGPWVEIWRAEKAQAKWNVKLPKHCFARYVKVGLRDTNELHLASIKLFGEEMKNVK